MSPQTDPPTKTSAASFVALPWNIALSPVSAEPGSICAQLVAWHPWGGGGGGGGIGQPAGSKHVPAEQTSASPRHAPATQRSLTVQVSPSLQDCWSAGVWLQAYPVDGPHESIVQALLSSQLAGQVGGGGGGGIGQPAGSEHVPAEQTSASPRHAPATQRSLTVQVSPSLQDCWSAGVWLQAYPVDGPHESIVQALLSSQLAGQVGGGGGGGIGQPAGSEHVPAEQTSASPRHAPATQRSLTVQVSPSLQDCWSAGVWLQAYPVDGPHESIVQALLSSQLAGQVGGGGGGR